jgi:two-component system cell cycle sensor histidine kinase/response regulator CckA
LPAQRNAIESKMDHREPQSAKRIFKQVKHALVKEGYKPDSQLLSSLIHSLPLNVFAKDREGRFIFANDFYCKSVGKSYAEVIGKDDFDVHPRELADKYRADDKRIMERCQVESIEEAWQSIGGTYHYIQVIKSPLFDDHQQVIGIIGIFWDITDRKQTEIELAEERNLLRTIIDIVPGYIYVKDRASRFLVANKAVASLMGADGPEDVIGQTDFDFYSETDARNFRNDELNVIREEKPLVDREESYYAPDGQLGWILTNKVPLRNLDGAVVGLVGMGLNITKRKEAEQEREKLKAQLLHAQKMETVGTLAGGLAHDLNNLLMGIQGHASLMALDIDEAHPCRPNIKAIEEFVQSATTLTNQLLGFARGGKYEIKPAAFNDLIDATAEMFSRTRKEIRILKTFEPNLWVVEADKRQMEQVLLNLFINAWQAMPGGGDLFLRTENVVLDEARTAPHAIKSGRFVKITITDTGLGMDEQTRQRIFDPFFTTKEIGRGTGLGLASAYGIVKNHGGIITVHSEPGHGTAFNIFLPASDKVAREDPVPQKAILQGSGTILIVDDEEMIRGVGKAMLEKLGYKVIAADGGQQAIETVTERGGEIDLVVLDLIMPGFDGRMTFARIREIRPDMPVMLSSGYSIDGQATEILQQGANGFIQKPFQLAELSHTIQQILDAHKPAGQA